MTPRTRWHVANYGPAAILALCTGPALLAGESPLAAVAVLLAAGSMAAQAWSYRARYKRGWYDGRMDLLREVAGDQDHGAEGRAPEPWAPRPLSPVIAVHRGHHPDCPHDHGQ